MLGCSTFFVNVLPAGNGQEERYGEEHTYGFIYP